MTSVIKIASEPILDADHPAKGVNFAHGVIAGASRVSAGVLIGRRQQVVAPR